MYRCVFVYYTGLAPMNGICQGSLHWGGVSISEDFGLHTWVVGAHELGHKYENCCTYMHIYIQYTVYLYLFVNSVKN